MRIIRIIIRIMRIMRVTWTEKKHEEKKGERARKIKATTRVIS